MLGILAKRGCLPVPDPSKADILIVNTCGFIEEAKAESIEAILDAARLKKRGRRPKLVVTGCLAQRYGGELAREFPEIDVLAGIDDVGRIADLLEDGAPPPGSFPLPRSLADARAPRRLLGPPYSAFLKISEGCDMRCAFCAIPAIRGRFRSRPIEDVVKEARHLAGDGVRELNLVAQDTSGYGRDLYGKPRLVDLLRRLSGVEGLEWVRIHYLDPARVTMDLVRAVADLPRVCPYFDVPLQHVNARVLRSMNRVGNRAVFERMIRGIRDVSPEAALRTTFIVGYPGETEAEFGELLEFVAEARFDHAGFFAYSREEGTAAADLPGQWDEPVRIERLNRANRVQEAVAPAAHERWLGAVRRMVVEGVSGGKTWGRVDLQAPEVDGVTWLEGARGPAKGTWIDVEVTDLAGPDLIGRRKGKA